MTEWGSLGFRAGPFSFQSLLTHHPDLPLRGICIIQTSSKGT